MQLGLGRLGRRGTTPNGRSAGDTFESPPADVSPVAPAPNRRSGLTITTAAVAALGTIASIGAAGTLIVRTADRHLAACHSLAFTGCNQRFNLTLTSRSAPAGGAARVSVVVKDLSGHAVPDAVVRFSYLNQTVITAQTDTQGLAAATFAQRADQAPVTAAVMEPSGWLSADHVASSATLALRPVAPAFPAAYEPILYRAGAYSVQTTDGVKSAAASGFSLIQTDNSTRLLREVAQSSGTTVIDSQIKNVMYQRLCGATSRTCHVPTATDILRIGQATTVAVKSRSGRASSTAAWYILDDYLFVSFRSVLEQIHASLRATGDQRPTVCAFGLHLARVGDADDAKVAIKAFAATLQNYDPRWCDTVMIYSYPPGTRFPVPAMAYDWTLSSTLPAALGLLRSRGWNPRTQPLLASPATFGFTPRVIDAANELYEYRAPPSPAEMATEIDAFCALGATSVVGYAWDDHSLGLNGAALPELGNTVALRRELIADVAKCRSLYWK